MTMQSEHKEKMEELREGREMEIPSPGFPWPSEIPLSVRDPPGRPRSPWLSKIPLAVQDPAGHPRRLPAGRTGEGAHNQRTWPSTEAADPPRRSRHSPKWEYQESHKGPMGASSPNSFSWSPNSEVIEAEGWAVAGQEHYWRGSGWPSRGDRSASSIELGRKPTPPHFVQALKVTGTPPGTGSVRAQILDTRAWGQWLMQDERDLSVESWALTS